MASRSSSLMGLASLGLFKKAVKKETLVLHFAMGVTEKWWWVVVVVSLAGKVMVEGEE